MNHINSFQTFTLQIKKKNGSKCIVMVKSFEDLATKKDIDRLVHLINTVNGDRKSIDEVHIGYISFKKLKEQTGMGAATIYRHEKSGNLKPYRLPGSNKKFYKLSEVKQAFEIVQ